MNNNGERMQSKQKQNQACQIQIDHALNNVMVSLKDGFTVWRQNQKEDSLLIIY